MKLQLHKRIGNSRLGSHLARHPTFWTCAILFAISFWLLSIRMYVPYEWGDEGYFANAALRILSGEVIYRDFQHNYPPGRMYALALLIKLFGQDLAVVRLFWVFCQSASVAVGYCVARRIMPLPFALVVALAILFNNVHQNKTVELLVSSLLLLTLFRVLERRTSDFVAGAAMGVLAYFRHDVAMMGFVLFYLQMFLQAHLSEDDTPYLSRLRHRWSEGWQFLMAFVLAGAPFVLYLLFQGAFTQAFTNLALAGFEANVVLSVPFPPLFTEWNIEAIWRGVRGNSVVFYTPPLVYALCALYALRSLRGGSKSLKTIQILVCAAFGVMVFAQVIPRTDIWHLLKAYIPAHILSFALIALISGAAISNLTQRRFGIALLCAVLVIPAVAIPIKLFIRHGGRDEALQGVLLTEFFGVGRPFHMVEFPYGRYKTRKPLVVRRMSKINAFIRKYEDQRKDEFMLVYPAGAIFNFLYDYRSPIAYDVLRPGELGGNAKEILQEVQRQIEAARPRVMIRARPEDNLEVAVILDRWVKNAGYEKYSAPRMDVWIRSDP